MTATDLPDSVVGAVWWAVVEVEDLGRSDDPVLAGALGSEEPVVARLGEVLPARIPVRQRPSLAVVSYVAVSRVAGGRAAGEREGGKEGEGWEGGKEGGMMEGREGGRERKMTI